MITLENKIIKENPDFLNFHFFFSIFRFMLDFYYLFMTTIPPLKMEVKHEENKNLKSIFFLIMFSFISLFEQFGNLNALCGVNRSISSDSDRVAKLDGDGNLTFSIKCQVASSGTRWKNSGIVCHQ